MQFPYHLSSILLLLTAFTVSDPTPSDLEERQSQVPTCTDGGTLYCCQATFSGGLAPIVFLSDLTCYDLTPNVVNCIITNAPNNLDGSGCAGTYSCCQVTTLAPLLGLFCSDPPGKCVGGKEQCTNILRDLPGCEDA